MSVDWGNIITGAGTVANAYGNYKNGKRNLAFQKDAFAYEKNKDNITANKQSLAQENLNNALLNTYGKDKEDKKKKKKSMDQITDAFVSPSSVA